MSGEDRLLAEIQLGGHLNSSILQPGISPLHSTIHGRP